MAKSPLNIANDDSAGVKQSWIPAEESAEFFGRVAPVLALGQIGMIDITRR